MRPDTIAGIFEDLHHFLNTGWTAVRDADRNRILPPPDAVGARNFDNLLHDEVWRVARSISYAESVCIERTAKGCYRIVTKLTSGGSLEVMVQNDQS